MRFLVKVSIPRVEIDPLMAPQDLARAGGAIEQAAKQYG